LESVASLGAGSDPYHSLPNTPADISRTQSERPDWDAQVNDACWGEKEKATTALQELKVQVSALQEKFEIQGKELETQITANSALRTVCIDVLCPNLATD
jgi:hypothetical protein